MVRIDPPVALSLYASANRRQSAIAKLPLLWSPCRPFLVPAYTCFSPSAEGRKSGFDDVTGCTGAVVEIVRKQGLGAIQKPHAGSIDSGGGGAVLAAVAPAEHYCTAKLLGTDAQCYRKLVVASSFTC